MTTFTPRPAGSDAVQEAGIIWLRETLDRLAPERDMPPGTTWQIEPGVREAGGSRGPRLSQVGFRITALHASGAVYALPCFVSGDDAMDEEQRLVLVEVLSLWLDRLSTLDPG
jgi:hypothetical protein